MAQSRVRHLKAAQKIYLENLGLSADAIQLFELLLRHGPLTAQDAATYNYHFPSAQYRLFYRLEALGLVRRRSGRPLTFEELPLENGLSASLALKQQELGKLLTQSLGRKSAGSDVPVRLVVGRQALYDEYARMAPRAKHSIAVYSIGIAYSAELVAVQRAAIRRGVQVRHVVQQFKPSNYHVLHAWQRMGVRVRLNRSERGFHLMLFDDELAIISFSNPSDTDDRLNIVTDSPAAIRLFQTDFNALWHEAHDIAV